MAREKQLSAVSWSISLAASATTDGLEASYQAVDSRGAAVAGVRPIEAWISEASTGIGLTADSYSGTVTASSGSIHTALTAKKHFRGVTNASGLLKLLAVDSANPADQYFCATNPNGESVVVSAVSGTNWEGA
jgi:hypothetical protein